MASQQQQQQPPQKNTNFMFFKWNKIKMDFVGVPHSKCMDFYDKHNTSVVRTIATEWKFYNNNNNKRH